MGDVDMQDRVTIDNLVEYLTKGGRKDIRFNVIYQPDVTKPNLYIAITGMRLAGGCLGPPMTCFKGKWYSPVFFGEDLAERLYDAITEELKARQIDYSLNSKKAAILDLVSVTKFCRLFPAAAGGF